MNRNNASTRDKRSLKKYDQKWSSTSGFITNFGLNIEHLYNVHIFEIKVELKKTLSETFDELEVPTLIGLVQH